MAMRSSLAYLLLMGTDEYDETWGEEANTVFQNLESAALGPYAIATTGGTTVLATSELPYNIYNVTGTLTSNAILQVPDTRYRSYLVRNATSGAYTLTIRAGAAGGTFVLGQGESITVFVGSGGTLTACKFGNSAFGGTVLSLANGGTGGNDEASAQAGLGLGTAATKNTGTSGNTIPLLDGNNTWSGTSAFNGTVTVNAVGFTMDLATGFNYAILKSNDNGVSFTLQGNAGFARQFTFQSGGNTRWAVATNNSAESSGNLGSNFEISRWDDAGTYIDNALHIRRSTGKTTLKSGCTTPVTLTDAATVAVDAALSNVFTLTIGGNRTLGAPTNLVAGQPITFIVTQDGTGGHTLAYDSAYKFPLGEVPTINSAIGAVSIITGIAVSSSVIYANMAGEDFS